jgi:hypothetical protein
MVECSFAPGAKVVACARKRNVVSESGIMRGWFGGLFDHRKLRESEKDSSAALMGINDSWIKRAGEFPHCLLWFYPVPNSLLVAFFLRMDTYSSLPPELERVVFEISALSRPIDIPNLMLIAWRVKEWYVTLQT